MSRLVAVPIIMYVTNAVVTNQVGWVWVTLKTNCEHATQAVVHEVPKCYV